MVELGENYLILLNQINQPQSKIDYSLPGLLHGMREQLEQNGHEDVPAPEITVFDARVMYTLPSLEELHYLHEQGQVPLSEMETSGTEVVLQYSAQVLKGSSDEEVRNIGNAIESLHKVRRRDIPLRIDLNGQPLNLEQILLHRQVSRERISTFPTQIVIINSQPVELTSIEAKLLRAVYSAGETGETQEALMKLIWGKPVNPGALAQRMHKLREKLRETAQASMGEDKDMIGNRYGGTYFWNIKDVSVELAEEEQQK